MTILLLSISPMRKYSCIGHNELVGLMLANDKLDFH